MAEIVKISDAVALGIHAATLLAADAGTAYSCKELAGILGVSDHHLAKVMQRLVRGDIVTSTRGPKGGFVLEKPPAETTFLQVMEAIDGPLKVPGCLIGKPKCNGQECVMGTLLHEIYEKSHRYFRQTTLADLARVIEK